MNARRELLQRYRRAWTQAWHNRQTMEAPARLPHEVQFLPAALSLQEQPVNPLARHIKWAIMAFLALAVLWACLGEIDVVASAQGKVVPSGKTKVIQPREVAVVKAIHVYDGQQVKAGDLLVELDGSQTTADVERLKSDLMAAQVDSARATVLLEAIEGGQEPASIASRLPQANEEQQRAAQVWMQGQYLELRSNINQAQAVIEQRSAEIQAALSMIASTQDLAHRRTTGPGLQASAGTQFRCQACLAGKGAVTPRPGTGTRSATGEAAGASGLPSGG